MSADIINLSSLFNVDTILFILIGTFAGIVIGALPGLTATMAVSLMVSLTYGMEARNALAILIALYLGGIYGGSRSAILLNVPGTPSSAATALEGFPLTQRARVSKRVLWPPRFPPSARWWDWSFWPAPQMLLPASL